MKNIKRVNELKKDYCLFVQVYVREEPYLRFGFDSHNLVFSAFLKEFNIEAEWECKSCGHYKTKTENYNWVGSGIAKRENKKIIFYRTSMEKPNKEHAKKISKLTGLEIIVQE